jgi:hypothetical protein
MTRETSLFFKFLMDIFYPSKGCQLTVPPFVTRSDATEVSSLTLTERTDESFLVKAVEMGLITESEKHDIIRATMLDNQSIEKLRRVAAILCDSTNARDEVIRKVEALSAYLFVLYRSRHTSDVAAATILYYQAMTKKFGFLLCKSFCGHDAWLFSWRL